MTFRFQCPDGHVLKAEPSMAGMKMRCPVCQQTVEVPLRPEDAGESGETPPGVKSTFVRPKKRPGPPPVEQPRSTEEKRAGTEIRRKQPPPLPGKRQADARWRDEEPEVQPTEPAQPVAAKKQPPRQSPRDRSATGPPQQPAKATPPPRPVNKLSAATTAPDEPAIEAPPVVGEETHAEEAAEARRGYVPDWGRRQTVYWLGLALFLVAIIGFLPARGHYGLSSAPPWALIVWVMTALQIAYIVYMVSIPDWSTAWVAMLVFAAVAAMYGFVLAMAIWTAGSDELLFDLEPVRANVARWSGGMLLLSFLAAFTAGRISHTWHKRYRYLS